MDNKSLKFDLCTPSESVALSNYLLALTENGLTFSLSQNGTDICVVLTGGF